MLRVRLVFALAAIALAGCGTSGREEPRPQVIVEAAEGEGPAWMKVATPEDITKLERLGQAWAAALADARSRGAGRAVAAEGALLDPAAALPRAAPSPGSYECRLVRLGSPGRGGAFTAYKPFFCHVGIDGDQLSITKQTGSRRPAGYLWDTDRSSRLIFLGSLALRDEETPLAYGENPARNMAGVFERHGTFRYRLVVPWPQDGSKLNVFELIPLPLSRQP